MKTEESKLNAQSKQLDIPVVMASDSVKPKNNNECHIGWDCKRYGRRCDEECNGCGWWYPLGG